MIPASARFHERKVGQAGFWAFDHLMPIAGALLYATLLARLPLEAFLDRANYLVYAAYSDVIIARFLSLGALTVLANEPLWLFLNIALAQLFPAEAGLRILIFVPAFGVAYLLLRHDPRNGLWIALFLLMPQVMKNHVIHLRQGVGLSVFLLGYFAPHPWRGRALMLAAGFIHSSFLFIALILGAIWALRALPLSPRFQVAVMVAGFALLGTGAGVVAQALGARQALAYAEASMRVSGLGFVFWALIAALFLSSGRAFLQAQMPALAILAFDLGTYFVLPYAARVFESGLVVVFLSGLQLAGLRRGAFVMGALAYVGLQYAIASPWSGWAVGG